MKKICYITSMLLCATLGAQQEYVPTEGTVQRLIKQFDAPQSVAKKSALKENAMAEQTQLDKLFKAVARNDDAFIRAFFASIQSDPKKMYAYLAATNDKGQTLLHTAIKYRHEQPFNTLLKLLLLLQDKGFEIQDVLNKRTLDGGNTAFHYAITNIPKNKNWNFATRLLVVGANLNIENEMGQSAIGRLRAMDANAASKLEVMDLMQKSKQIGSSDQIELPEDTSQADKQEMDQTIQDIPQGQAEDL